ncbi:M48 family metallopeptidase [Aquimarina sp. SS2-1]|uniref:M48 family metallopeptidase n=1 Tax=Aquimarina besae TaxID=3342247 RepID=UPI0036704E3D
MIYPENPIDVPEGLTKVSKKYTQKVVLAILGLVLFFVLYFFMIVGFGYLAYYNFLEFQTDRGSMFNLAISIGAIMLFLFTLKFIFKRNSFNDKITKEISHKDNRDLYDFIMKIAADAKASVPKKILIDYDVNASVSFNSTFWSLFSPGKKNLRIGLALVNGLNISEFKAVVAHEFGHFSQSSMRIGSYVYMTNKIIHDMIFERDYWDRALEIWRSVDIRLSFIAWIITPFVWLIRQLLFLLYKLLNILHASLSREMEFHADKVAVSLTGSKAIIEALWKLEHVHTAWNETLSHTGTAASQKIYTENLFLHHQDLLNDKQTVIENLIKNREKDDKGREIIFKEKDMYSSLDMYASHPSGKDREENAKTPFIEGVEDTSDSWSLFNNPENMQEEITKRMYLHAMGVSKEELVQSSEKMINFINEEKQTEQIFGEEYLGNFQERYFTIPEKKSIAIHNPFSNYTIEQIKTEYSKLIKEILPELMKPAKEFEGHFKVLVEMSNGINKSKFFEYKGTKYKKKNIKFAAERIDKEKMEYFEQAFNDWDRDLIQLSYMASNESERESYLGTLDMLEICQANLKRTVSQNTRIINLYNELSSQGSVSEDAVIGLIRETNLIIPIFSKGIDDLEETEFIPLPNIESKEEMLQLLGKDKVLSRITQKSFEDGKFAELLDFSSSVIYTYNRMIFKITASILKPLEIL